MKPDFLQKLAMMGMFVLILLSFAVANVQSLIWIKSSWLVSTILPAVVVSETNDARAKEDLQPLSRNSVLDRAAQMKADDMAAHSYFAHKSPDGITPWYWFKQAGYTYAYAGENLAVHFTDSTAVVDAWLKSPTHRANVMNGNYTEIGIGTAKGKYEGFDTVFVVQLFGTPAVPTPTPVAVAPEAQALVKDTQKPQPVASPHEEAALPTTTVAKQPDSVTVDSSVTGDGTLVYESYVATATPGAVLAATAVGDTATPVSFWDKLMTSPQILLQIAYSIIGVIVMSLLFYTLIFEWKHHHPIQTAYSVGLLVMMLGLFFLHLTVTGGIVT